MCSEVPTDSQSQQVVWILLFILRNRPCLWKDGFTSPVITKKNCQLFLSVFLIVVRTRPKTLTQNFSKSGFHKARAFINVYSTRTYTAALVKVCFYLILKILLLMVKLSHKLGKCSITSLTEIDSRFAAGQYQQVKAKETTTPANVGATSKVTMNKCSLPIRVVFGFKPGSCLCLIVTICIRIPPLCGYRHSWDKTQLQMICISIL